MGDDIADPDHLERLKFELERQIDDLRAETERLRKDAERFRMLRDSILDAVVGWADHSNEAAPGQDLDAGSRDDGRDD